MIQFTKLPPEEIPGVKAAMERIRTENPEYWSNGLSLANFGGNDTLWAIKEANQTMGFVGWQERHDPEGRKVGYYSIGVLPPYRRRGIAKEAVAAVITKLASRVDVVKAAIVETNTPSRALAECLGVDIELEKQAMSPATKALLGWMAGGALVGGPGLDYAYHHKPDKSMLENYRDAFNDPARRKEMGINSVLGVLSGLVGSKKGPVEAAGVGLMIPGKDLILNANKKLHGIDPKALMDAAEQAAKPPAQSPRMSPKVMAMLAAAGLLGAGGLAYAGIRGSGAVSDLARKASKGRVRVTLPTKQPGDAETTVEVPIEDVDLSQNLYRNLGRDTRRRLRAESRERKVKFKQEQRGAKNLGVQIDDEGRVVEGGVPMEDELHPELNAP